MSAPLSHTQNIKGSREIYMAGARAERNAKLPLHLHLPAVPEPVDHLGTFRDQANCCHSPNSVLSCSPRQALRAGKKPPLVFNKVWGYFSPSVMPLLLHIGSAVKAIDCEPAPQPGHRREGDRGVSCLHQVIYVCVSFIFLFKKKRKKKKSCLHPADEGVMFFSRLKVSGVRVSLSVSPLDKSEWFHFSRRHDTSAVCLCCRYRIWLLVAVCVSERCMFLTSR